MLIKFLDGTEKEFETLQNANLQNADLRYANLQNADLRYANLQNADLRYADLRYANLQNADLRYAKGIIIGPRRSDGYLFILSLTEQASWKVIAGCRKMYTEQYREHTKSYCNKQKEQETNDILDYLEKRLQHVQENA